METRKAPNRSRDTEAAIEHSIYIGRATPNWPKVGEPMGKDPTVAMQFGYALVAVPGADADDFLRLEHHLNSVAIGVASN